MQVARGLLLCIVMCRPAIAQGRGSSPAPDDSSIVARLDAYLAPLVSAHEFSGTILIRRHGETVADRSYGMASREFAVPNDRDTRFLIVSRPPLFPSVGALPGWSARNILTFGVPNCST